MYIYIYICIHDTLYMYIYIYKIIMISMIERWQSTSNGLRLISISLLFDRCGYSQVEWCLDDEKPLKKQHRGSMLEFASTCSIITWDTQHFNYSQVGSNRYRWGVWVEPKSAEIVFGGPVIGNIARKLGISARGPCIAGTPCICINHFQSLFHFHKITW